MRPMKRLIQLDKALALAMSQTTPITRVEMVHLLDSVGRVAAIDVVSKAFVPPFSRSAMDGYALKATNTLGASKLHPLRFRRTEAIYAGSVPKKPIRKGECAEIATGAMLPKGSDSVVMVEDTEAEDRIIHIFKPVHRGENVSRKGEDISPGMKVISAGETLNPSKAGALAALGRESVDVFARPLVGIVPTGDEIAPLGSKLKPGQVFNINSYTLASVVRANGGEARILSKVNDSLSELESALKRNSDCDMMVFSGGSSVGERDIMLDLLEKVGEVVFHGVAIKPGKPTLFGVVSGQLVWGMPGYPTACLSNAYILLAPVLRRMARLSDLPPATVEATMSNRVTSTTGRTQFLTVRLQGGYAFPAFKESGAITSMAFADGYIVIPSDVDLIEKGEKVLVYLL